jgi:drug/metabolite transporter (DMT)-like permease
MAQTQQLTLCSRKAAIFGAALLAGTACSLCSKTLLSIHGESADGNDEALASPPVQTAAMFFGMLIALPMYWVGLWCENRKGWTRGYEAVVEPRPPVPTWLYFLMAAPSIFDMLATTLCMFGLVSVNVSLYQMLRGGSSIAFTSIMKHYCLPGDGLKKHNWVGVFLCIISIILCGLSVSAGAAADDSSSDSTQGSPLIGVMLILCGGLVQSIQYVFEERVMDEDMGLAPMLVVGLEGLWGFFFCLTLILPVLYYLPGNDHGHLSDPINSVELILENKPIYLTMIAYTCSIFTYNSLSVMVTKELDAVWHSILDLWRPITVWVLDLFLHYDMSTSLGEAWTYPASYIQLAAMIVLLYGTAIYNQSIDIPFWLGGMESDAKASDIYASPMLTSSPFIQRTINARELKHVHPSNVRIDLKMKPMGGQRQAAAEI